MNYSHFFSSLLFPRSFSALCNILAIVVVGAVVAILFDLHWIWWLFVSSQKKRETQRERSPSVHYSNTYARSGGYTKHKNRLNKNPLHEQRASTRKKWIVNMTSAKQTNREKKRSFLDTRKENEIKSNTQSAAYKHKWIITLRCEIRSSRRSRRRRERDCVWAECIHRRFFFFHMTIFVTTIMLDSGSYTQNVVVVAVVIVMHLRFALIHNIMAYFEYICPPRQCLIECARPRWWWWWRRDVVYNESHSKYLYAPKIKWDTRNSFIINKNRCLLFN